MPKMTLESLTADAHRADALYVRHALSLVSTEQTAVYSVHAMALNVAMLDPTVQEAYRAVWGQDWSPLPPVATLADVQRDALRTVLLRDLPWADSDVVLCDDEGTLEIMSSGAATRVSDYCDYGAML